MEALGELVSFRFEPLLNVEAPGRTTDLSGDTSHFFDIQIKAGGRLDEGGQFLPGIEIAIEPADDEGVHDDQPVLPFSK